MWLSAYKAGRFMQYLRDSAAGADLTAAASAATLPAPAFTAASPSASATASATASAALAAAAGQARSIVKRCTVDHVHELFLEIAVGASAFIPGAALRILFESKNIFHSFSPYFYSI